MFRTFRSLSIVMLTGCIIVSGSTSIAVGAEACWVSAISSCHGGSDPCAVVGAECSWKTSSTQGGGTVKTCKC